VASVLVSTPVQSGAGILPGPTDDGRIDVAEAVVLTIVVVAAALAIAGFGFFVWLFVLPFRLVGFLFKLALGLIALPIALVFGFLGLTALGIGALVLALPMLVVLALPILLFFWMLGGFRRRDRHAVRA